MVDERGNAVLPVVELDAVELEELAEDPTDVTGEFTRPGSIAAPASKTSPGRVSVPPPVPKEAREARRPSLPPGSLPPAPLPAGAVIPTSNSGMFRIESTPPAKPARPGDAAVDPALAALHAELREVRAHNDRLRLTVRLRDDRIQELERLLVEQRGRTAALQLELDALHTRKPPDDLKRIRGVGPGFERALHALGVVSFRQIAAWTPEERTRIERAIRALPGRIERERWIEAARELAESDG